MGSTLALLALALASLAGCNRGETQEKQTNTDTAPVERRDIVVNASATGVVEPVTVGIRIVIRMVMIASTVISSTMENARRQARDNAPGGRDRFVFITGSCLSRIAANSGRRAVSSRSRLAGRSEASDWSDEWFSRPV
mgnify:CR=1 FL=1